MPQYQPFNTKKNQNKSGDYPGPRFKNFWPNSVFGSLQLQYEIYVFLIPSMFYVKKIQFLGTFKNPYIYVYLYIWGKNGNEGDQQEFRKMHHFTSQFSKQNPAREGGIPPSLTLPPQSLHSLIKQLTFSPKGWKYWCILININITNPVI